MHHYHKIAPTAFLLPPSSIHQGYSQQDPLLRPCSRSIPPTSISRRNRHITPIRLRLGIRRIIQLLLVLRLTVGVMVRLYSDRRIDCPACLVHEGLADMGVYPISSPPDNSLSAIGLLPPVSIVELTRIVICHPHRPTLPLTRAQRESTTGSLTRLHPTFIPRRVRLVVRPYIPFFTARAKAIVLFIHIVFIVSGDMCIA